MRWAGLTLLAAASFAGTYLAMRAVKSEHLWCFSRKRILVTATHSGMMVEEFDKTVSNWIATAKHPKTGRLYTQRIYQPMVELLESLRTREFKAEIVS